MSKEEAAHMVAGGDNCEEVVQPDWLKVERVLDRRAAAAADASGYPPLHAEDELLIKWRGLGYEGRAAPPPRMDPCSCTSKRPSRGRLAPPPAPAQDNVGDGPAAPLHGRGGGARGRLRGVERPRAAARRLGAQAAAAGDGRAV